MATYKYSETDDAVADAKEYSEEVDGFPIQEPAWFAEMMDTLAQEPVEDEEDFGTEED